MKKYWEKNKTLTALLVLLIFISEGLVTYIAVLYGKILDLAKSGMNNQLASFFVILLILSVLMPFSFYLYSLVIQRIRVKIQTAMRKDLFVSLLERDYKKYLEHDEGNYISSYTTEIDSLDSTYFRAIFGILQIIALFIFAFIALYRIYPKFAFYNLLGVIPAILIPHLFKKKISDYQADKIKKVSENVARLNEYLSGLETIFLFGRRKAFYRKLRQQNEEIRKITTKIGVVMLLTVNLSLLLLQLYSIIMIGLATLEIARGNISAGVFITALQIFSDQSGVAFTSHYLQQFHISSRTIENILQNSHYEIRKRLKNEEVMLTDEISEIDYSNVVFSFEKINDTPNEEVLISNFNYKFKKPGIYQIVGPSGSGKSTLMNLLLGYHQPQKGSVKINGTNVENIINLNQIATVMRQEAIFFDGTLRENITMFRKMDDKVIMDGLSKLGLQKLQNLQDCSLTYSGGEERRLMLLRALLRNPKILILDEPLANLDLESQKKVEMEIERIKDKFVFVITHEPLSIPVEDTLMV